MIPSAACITDGYAGNSDDGEWYRPSSPPKGDRLQGAGSAGIRYQSPIWLSIREFEEFHPGDVVVMRRSALGVFVE